jgi:hypothetical protein
MPTPKRAFEALAGCSLATLIMAAPQASLADEGGLSFWVPGFFGSLAATPQQPGFSLATIFYHAPPVGGADVASRARSSAAASPRISPAT